MIRTWCRPRCALAASIYTTSAIIYSGNDRCFRLANITAGCSNKYGSTGRRVCCVCAIFTNGRNRNCKTCIRTKALEICIITNTIFITGCEDEYDAFPITSFLPKISQKRIEQQTKSYQFEYKGGAKLNL